MANLSLPDWYVPPVEPPPPRHPEFDIADAAREQQLNDRYLAGRREILNTRFLGSMRHSTLRTRTHLNSTVLIGEPSSSSKPVMRSERAALLVHLAHFKSIDETTSQLTARRAKPQSIISKH